MINADKVTKKDSHGLKKNFKLLCKMMDKKYNVSDEYRPYHGYLTEKEFKKSFIHNTPDWMLSFIYAYSPKKKIYYWIQIRPFSIDLGEGYGTPSFFKEVKV